MKFCQEISKDSMSETLIYQSRKSYNIELKDHFDNL